MRKWQLPKLSFRVPMPTGIYLSGGTIMFGGVVFIALIAASAMLMVVKEGPPLPLLPEPGTYFAIASADGTELVGRHNPVNPSTGQRDHTLRIILGGNRINTLTFKDISLGETGLTNSIEITNSATSTPKHLKCETVILDGVEAPTFTLSNSEVYRIAATSTVSGHTISPTLDLTIEDVVVGSTRGAGEINAEGKTVDRIVIDVNSNDSDALCNTLRFENVRASIGGVDIQQLKAGTLIITEASRFGADSDISDSDFTIATTTLYSVLNDGVTDAPVSVQ